MSAGLYPGALRIRATVAAGKVCDITITGDRPVSLASAMVGRAPAQVAEAVAALHGLCGQSHACAVRFAAAAAHGEALPPSETRAWALRLAGERLAEHSRSLFLVAAAQGGEALREVLTAGQRAARTGERPDGPGFAEALRRLDAWAGGQPAPRSAAPVWTDALGPGDDAAVVAAMASAPGFLRAPSLPGRTVETGPAARRGVSAADPPSAWYARLAEWREAGAILRGAVPPPAGWIGAGRPGVRCGYAAVETPRGRLHYRMVLDGNGNLAEARVLAPTEWNFHPTGPLACALRGRALGPDARADLTRRIAAFDPCVEFHVDLADA